MSFPRRSNPTPPGYGKRAANSFDRLARGEFDRWFDARLDRTRRAAKRYEAIVRRRRWRCAATAVLATLFLTFALAGLVSELVGAYWGPFGR